jgi:rhodanese-related sulfurtransferase
MKAALFLRQRGLPAKSLAGGIDLWSLDIDPAIPRY